MLVDRDHLERMRDGVAHRGPALEAIHRKRILSAFGAAVDADREVEFLRLLPQWIVGAVVERAGVVVWIGPHEAGAKAQLMPGKAHLVDELLDRGLHRQHRRPE